MGDDIDSISLWNCIESMKGLDLRKKEIKEPPLPHIKLYLHFYVAYSVDIFLSFPTLSVGF